MTKVILRAHPYPTDIWSGLVLVPRKWLSQLIDEMDDCVTSRPHPRVCFFMFLVPERLLFTFLEEPEPEASDMVFFHVYDALGEQHGRRAFSWVLEKPGAIDRTKVRNMRGVVDMESESKVLTKEMHGCRIFADSSMTWGRKRKRPARNHEDLLRTYGRPPRKQRDLGTLCGVVR
jgi:hypothetical protein